MHPKLQESSLLAVPIRRSSIQNPRVCFCCYKQASQICLVTSLQWYSTRFNHFTLLLSRCLNGLWTEGVSSIFSIKILKLMTAEIKGADPLTNPTLVYFCQLEWNLSEPLIFLFRFLVGPVRTVNLYAIRATEDESTRRAVLYSDSVRFSIKQQQGILPRAVRSLPCLLLLSELCNSGILSVVWTPTGLSLWVYWLSSTKCECCHHTFLFYWSFHGYLGMEFSEDSGCFILLGCPVVGHDPAHLFWHAKHSQAGEGKPRLAAAKKPCYCQSWPHNVKSKGPFN